MKAIIITYLLLVHLFIAIVVVKTDVLSRIQVKLGYKISKPEFSPHYLKMVSFYQRVDKNIPDKSIVIIGDSLIQGLAVIGVSPHSVNFGIGGDTTVGVLKRIPFYHSIIEAKMVIIAIGVNDIFRGWDNNEILNNYLKIIELIPDTIPILFSAVLPVDEAVSNKTGINHRIKALNKALYNLSGSDRRLYYLDISTLIIDDDGNLSSVYHIGDGIHLNSLGNKIWISKLNSTVRKLLK